ncbi:hypothetical protein MHYP_G00340980 [Metynnis hypsauchen]
MAVFFIAIDCESSVVSFNLQRSRSKELGGEISTAAQMCACVYFKCSFGEETPRGPCTNQRRRGAGPVERCVDDGKRTKYGPRSGPSVTERQFWAFFSARTVKRDSE